MEKSVQFTPKLNIIIGLNGAGKSSLLQAIGFVCSLAEENQGEWLHRRNWSGQDLVSKFPLSRNRKIDFAMTLSPANLKNAGEGAVKAKDGVWQWSGCYEAPSDEWMGVCSSEEISYNGELIASYGRKRPQGKMSGENSILAIRHKLAYRGSLLSIWKEEPLDELNQLIDSCYSLELLAPNLMRTRVRKSDVKHLGLGGEQIAPTLKNLREKDRERLIELMQRFYPSFSGYGTRTVRGGAVELTLLEKFGDKSSLSTVAMHASDGMLRVLAIVTASLLCEGGTLIIDELEDGINPALLEKLVDYFMYDAPCQTIVTSHQPFMLSCLTDSQAKKAVQLMYRDAGGYSQCCPFFSLPQPAELLGRLFPGEVMLQTDLELVSLLAATSMREDGDSVNS